MQGFRLWEISFLKSNFFSDPAQVSLGNAKVRGQILQWDILNIIRMIAQQCGIALGSTIPLKLEKPGLKLKIFLFGNDLYKAGPVHMILHPFIHCFFFSTNTSASVIACIFSLLRPPEINEE